MGDGSTWPIVAAWASAAVMWAILLGYHIAYRRARRRGQQHIQRLRRALHIETADSTAFPRKDPDEQESTRKGAEGGR